MQKFKGVCRCKRLRTPALKHGKGCPIFTLCSKKNLISRLNFSLPHFFPSSPLLNYLKLSFAAIEKKGIFRGIIVLCNYMVKQMTLLILDLASI